MQKDEVQIMAHLPLVLWLHGLIIQSTIKKRKKQKQIHKIMAHHPGIRILPTS